VAASAHRRRDSDGDGALIKADLQRLITDSLLLWGVWGHCAWTDDGLLVSTVLGRRVLVRRAIEVERPARWIMQILEVKGGAAGPDRSAGSIVGLLVALRKALGVAQAGGRGLRIVPSGSPASPLPPRETQARRSEPASSDNPASSPRELSEPTRVSIVTGFLGSGKTTFIQKVLRDPRFARTAVIVNEFGEVGLDHDVLASSSDALIQLSTGCLCCAIRSDLIETLLDLHRRRADGEVNFERIIIETSGLADPVPILQSLMTDKAVATQFNLDRVLTLVDAVHGPATVTAHVEARRQIAVADRILVTKTDVTEPSAALLDELRALNPNAPHAFAIQDAATLDWLIECDSSRDARRAAEIVVLRDSAPRHTGSLETITFVSASPIPALALTLFLQALADHAGDRLLRVKGLIQVAEMPDQPALVHGVQHVFAAPEWLEAWPSHERHTRIVFIGASIPRRWPARLLEAVTEDVLEAQRLAFADARGRPTAASR
jgi:G3E family GTPase